jgi:hypothetical protein
MVGYKFKSQFASLVESGQKRQTIRALGKRRHARPGERLLLYTGQQAKGYRKLVEPDPVCSSVSAVRIEPDAVIVDGVRYERGDDELAEIAALDGFESVDEFFDFFDGHYGLPFDGRLIRWAADQEGYSHTTHRQPSRAAGGWYE